MKLLIAVLSILTVSGAAIAGEGPRWEGGTVVYNGAPVVTGHGGNEAQPWAGTPVWEGRPEDNMDLVKSDTTTVFATAAEAGQRCGGSDIVMGYFNWNFELVGYICTSMGGRYIGEAGNANN